MNFSAMLKQPSAFLPVAMSCVALAMVLVHVALFGAAAHMFQLLMVAQVPIVVYFAIKWLGQAPRQALLVVALQFGAALAALAPVFYFNL